MSNLFSEDNLNVKYSKRKNISNKKPLRYNY